MNVACHMCTIENVMFYTKTLNDVNFGEAFTRINTTQYHVMWDYVIKNKKLT